MLKLSNFGAAAILARKGDKGCQSQSLSHDMTTFRYAAPEVLRRERYDLSADVWGIGVICWEMLQSDPRVPAVCIDNRDGHEARVRAVEAFQKVVETHRDDAPKVPVFHMAWCLLQEASRRPSANDTLTFAVFDSSPDVPVAGENAGDALGQALPTPEGTALPTTEGIPPRDKALPTMEGTVPGDLPTMEGTVPGDIAGLLTPGGLHDQGDSAAAESMGLPKEQADVVIQLRDLMPFLLPGDVQAFTKVTQWNEH
jgi:serine/threonine protein kinase